MFRLCMQAVMLSTSAAQIFRLGKCPDVPLQTNFDITQYEGVWYEIENVFFFPEVGQKCIQAEYTYDSSASKIIIVNRGITKRTNEHVSTEATATQNLNDLADWTVSYADVGRTGHYLVWKTDYTTYALVFTCQDIKWYFRLEVVWILSRSQGGISSATRSMLYQLMESYGFRPSYLKMTDQSNCPARK